MIDRFSIARVLFHLGDFDLFRIGDFHDFTAERVHEIKHASWILMECPLVPGEEYESGLVPDEFSLGRPSFCYYYVSGILLLLSPTVFYDPPSIRISHSLGIHLSGIFSPRCSPQLGIQRVGFPEVGVPPSKFSGFLLILLNVSLVEVGDSHY